MSAQSIYTMLRQAGMTHAGACGMLGNMDCESNVEPYRLQGDFTGDRIKSWVYVNDVDLGNMSREKFANDSKGYGLCQWTFHSRKAALYDYAKACGVSIADEEMQVKFAIRELQKDFPELWTLLCTTDSMQKASDGICKKFENPAAGELWVPSPMIIPFAPPKKIGVPEPIASKFGSFGRGDKHPAPE